MEVLQIHHFAFKGQILRVILFKGNEDRFRALSSRWHHPKLANVAARMGLIRAQRDPGRGDGFFSLLLVKHTLTKQVV